jgi:diguanylate cyclase (GGDEF)-like protein
MITDKEYVVVLLDIDNFKFINDMYGHDIGDKVLKNLASALKKEFPQKSIIGRNGGDEFCMILEDTSADDVKMKLAYFVENSVHECICDGETYEYSISMGYAEYPKDTSKNTELLRLADIALYDVKLKGKSGVQQYKDNMCSTKRAQLGFNLDDISDNLPGAFFIYKADVNDDKILYTNQEMIQLVGCTDLDDFYAFSKRHFRNLIKPDEVERVENSIWKQISYNDGMTEDFVIYHICTKNGQYKKVIDYGRIVENNYYGKVFYVLLIDYDSIKE